MFPARIVNAFSDTDTSFLSGIGAFTAPNTAFLSSGKRHVNGIAVTVVKCNGLVRKSVAA